MDVFQKLSAGKMEQAAIRVLELVSSGTLCSVTAGAVGDSFVTEADISVGERGVALCPHAMDASKKINPNR